MTRHITPARRIACALTVSVVALSGCSTAESSGEAPSTAVPNASGSGTGLAPVATWSFAYPVPAAVLNNDPCGYLFPDNVAYFMGGAAVEGTALDSGTAKECRWETSPHGPSILVAFHYTWHGGLSDVYAAKSAWPLFHEMRPTSLGDPVVAYGTKDGRPQKCSVAIGIAVDAAFTVDWTAPLATPGDDACDTARTIAQTVAGRMVP